MTSFLTIGGVWIAHHRLLSRLRIIDATIVELNLLLLLFTAFLPFPTAILAEALRVAEHTAEVAVALYGATVLAIELVLQTLTRYVASRRQPADDQSEETESAARRSWLSPIVVLYAVAICVAFVGLPNRRGVLLVLAIPSVVLAGAHGRLLRWSQAPDASRGRAYRWWNRPGSGRSVTRRNERLFPVFVARRPRMRRRAR
jgi:uncharacterized membrane protein